MGGIAQGIGMMLDYFQRQESNKRARDEFDLKSKAWELTKDEATTKMKQQKMILDPLEKAIQGGIITKDQASSILLDPKGIGATLWSLAQWNQPTQQGQGQFTPESTPEPYEIPTGKFLPAQGGQTQGQGVGLPQIIAQGMFGGMNQQDVMKDVLYKETGIGRSQEPVGRPQPMYNPANKSMQMAISNKANQVTFLNDNQGNPLVIPPDVKYEKVMKNGIVIMEARSAKGARLPEFDIENIPQETQTIPSLTQQGGPGTAVLPKNMPPGTQPFIIPSYVAPTREEQDVPGGGKRKVWVNPPFMGGTQPQATGGGVGGYSELPEIMAPIKTDDLPLYVHRNTLQSPKVGTTPQQAEEQGYVRVTTNAKTQIESLKGANTVISKFGKMMTNIFPPQGEAKMGPLEERIRGGTTRTLGALAQTNTEAAKFVSFVKGTMAPLIRSLGEKGNLSDNDMKRAIELLPKLSDTSEVAWGKYQQLTELFRDVQRASISGTYDTEKGGVNFQPNKQKSSIITRSMELMNTNKGDTQKVMKQLRKEFSEEEISNFARGK